MKQLLYILFITLIVVGCQKSNVDLNDNYTGDWSFEVTYTSNDRGTNSETVVVCEGMIIPNQNTMEYDLHYCIGSSLKILIDSEGVIRTENNKLLGVIDSETCLIVDNHPTEKSISKITIKGNK